MTRDDQEPFVELAKMPGNQRVRRFEMIIANNVLDTRRSEQGREQGYLYCERSPHRSSIRF
jgi:hypothetical protein